VFDQIREAERLVERPQRASPIVRGEPTHVGSGGHGVNCFSSASDITDR
jgi:hypothetical protein